MSTIDYENLFIYMSLIFAFCIFIILLYGCAYAGDTKNSQVFEKFSEKGKEDMKEQILLLLNDLKNKDTTAENDKNDLDVIIKTFSSSNVNVTDLVAIIKKLKNFDPVKETAPSPPSSNNTDTTSPSAPSAPSPPKQTQSTAPSVPSASSAPTAPSITTTTQASKDTDPNEQKDNA